MSVSILALQNMPLYLRFCFLLKFPQVQTLFTHTVHICVHYVYYIIKLLLCKSACFPVSSTLRGEVIPEGHSKCLNHHDTKLPSRLQSFLVTFVQPMHGTMLSGEGGSSSCHLEEGQCCAYQLYLTLLYT